MFQKVLLLVEDAGLLEGVLALSHVPHPDRPVSSTRGQQAFFTAPTARDDLSEPEKVFNIKRFWAVNQPGNSCFCTDSLCSDEPPVWWRSTCVGHPPCRRRSAAGCGCCRGRGRPACGPAVGRPTGGAGRKAWRTGSRPPERWPAPEALQRRDYGKDGHTNAQLDLLDMEHKVTKLPGEWEKDHEWKKTNMKTQKAQKKPKGWPKRGRDKHVCMKAKQTLLIKAVLIVL